MGVDGPRFFLFKAVLMWKTMRNQGNVGGFKNVSLVVFRFNEGLASIQFPVAGLHTKARMTRRTRDQKISGLWFQTCFIFPYSGNNHPK